MAGHPALADLMESYANQKGVVKHHLKKSQAWQHMPLILARGGQKQVGP